MNSKIRKNKVDRVTVESEMKQQDLYAHFNLIADFICTTTASKCFRLGFEGKTHS